MSNPGMKLILFLGAGVSVPSGLPTAQQLTSAIFRRAYHQDNYVYFSPGRHPVPHLRATDVTPRIHRLLRLLSKHDERDRKLVGYYPEGNGYRSSGAIFRGPTTYEDLFFLCQEISLWNKGLTDNSLITPFMELMVRRARGLFAGSSIKARMCDLGSLAEQACFFIESVVAGELRPKGLAGFDLIRELATAPHIEELNIVTLNHDTLVERFLAENRVDFVDGFGERDGDVRWYDDRLYDVGHARVRLVKLHGSVNWYSFLRDGISRPAIILGTNVEHLSDGEGTQLTPTSPRPSFLSGINKAVAYQRGIFGDMSFRFHQLLRQCKLMLMSGYGWGDTAINFQLNTWLDHCRCNTIILLHQSPEELVDRSLILASGYDAWTRSQQLIPIPKWLCEVSLIDLESHLVSGVH